MNYRRAGHDAYSPLPLERASGGDWIGEIPASWTENDSGFILEYFVTTLDADGMPLLVLGNHEQPLTVSMDPGKIDRTEFYETVWFWSTVGAVVVAGGITSYLLLKDSSDLPQIDLGRVPIF